MLQITSYQEIIKIYVKLLFYLREILDLWLRKCAPATLSLRENNIN